MATDIGAHPTSYPKAETVVVFGVIETPVMYAARFVRRRWQCVRGHAGDDKAKFCAECGGAIMSRPVIRTPAETYRDSYAHTFRFPDGREEVIIGVAIERFKATDAILIDTTKLMEAAGRFSEHLAEWAEPEDRRLIVATRAWIGYEP